jgi:hypothetical protein
MERRVGLTIKLRAHFTNIYAPFCPDCGLATESRKALQTHLAMTHGKRLVHYKLRPGAVRPHYVSRPLNIEGQELNGELLDEYLSDMKRIWRLSEVGHTDLIFIERIERKSPKEKALYSICLAIVARGVEEAITTAAKRMRRVTEYVRQHSDLVQRIQRQRRYSRLKTAEAKARLLALGLANPTVSLTYAERADANRREFTRDDRAIHYAGTKTKHHRINRRGD